MAEYTPCYDETSSFWIEQFSVIVNNILPIEYIFADWYQWQAYNKTDLSLSANDSQSPRTVTETGSRADGLCIPKCLVSDIDQDAFTLSTNEITYWEPGIHIMKPTDYFVQIDGERLPIFSVDHFQEDPRYVRLIITKECREYYPHCKTQTLLDHSCFFPFVDDYRPVDERSENPKKEWRYGIYGSVQTTIDKEAIYRNEIDNAMVFTYPRSWPEAAMEWCVRPRTGAWPTDDLIQNVLQTGCHIAPITKGKNRRVAGVVDGESADWILSFFEAENKLGRSVTPTQRHIFVLLNTLNKLYFTEVISSYYLKHLLFWEIENTNETFWNERNSAKCLVHMLDRLHQCLEQGHLPHFIMADSNLLKYEEERKIKKAAEVVFEVRKNIVEHCISLFNRIVPLSFESQTFQRNLELESFLFKLKDPNQPLEVNHQILCLLLCLFIKKYKECLEEEVRIIQNELGIEKSIIIRVHIYESLLARSFANLGIRVISECDQSTEEFVAFMKRAMQPDHCSEELMKTSVLFFEHAKKDKELSLLVPDVIDGIKELQLQRILEDRMEDSTSPFTELLSIAQSEDCFEISNLLMDLGITVNDKLVTHL